MLKKAVLFALLCVFSLVSLEEAGFSAAVSASNDYIEISQMDVARFIIKTRKGDSRIASDDNKNLLYEDNPPTTYATIRIDGKNYKFGGSDGKITNIAKSEGKITTSWECAGIEVTQVLSIVEGITTGRQDTVKIEYVVNNKDSNNRRVGVRILLDTLLGTNDGAPFNTPNMTGITTETVFEAKQVPDYWYAYDSLTSPTIRSQGILKGEGLVSPDRIAFASWGRLSKDDWDFSPEKSKSFSSSIVSPPDSAVALYFLEKDIPAGGAHSVATMYGLYGMDVYSQSNFNIGVSGPFKVNMGEIFSITANIENNSDSIAISNIEAKLEFPPNTPFLVKDEAVRKEAKILPKNILKYSWTAQALEGDLAGDFGYKISVNGALIDKGREFEKSAEAKRSITVIKTETKKTEQKPAEQPKEIAQEEANPKTVEAKGGEGSVKINETVLESKATVVSGEVSVVNSKTNQKQKGKSGMVISEGDVIQLDKNALAEVQISGVSTVKIKEKTKVEVEKTKKEGNKTDTKLKLWKGKLKVDVKKATADSKFEIQTPSAVCGVRGTSFAVNHDEENNVTRVEVFEGEVDMKRIDQKDEQPVMLKKNQQADASGQEIKPAVELDKNVAQEWQEWEKRKEEALKLKEELENRNRNIEDVNKSLEELNKKIEEKK